MWFKWAMYGFGHAFEPGIFVQRDDGFWFSSCLFFNFYFSERPRLTNHSFDFSLTCATHIFYHGRMLVWTKPPANCIWKPIVDTWFEQRFFCRHMSNSDSCFFQYKTADPNNENNLLFFLNSCGSDRPATCLACNREHHVPRGASGWDGDFLLASSCLKHGTNILTGQFVYSGL